MTDTQKLALLILGSSYVGGLLALLTIIAFKELFAAIRRQSAEKDEDFVRETLRWTQQK